MLTHAKGPAKGQLDTVASAQAAEVRRQAQIAWTLQGRWTPVWRERKGGVVGHDPEAYFRSGAKEDDASGLSLSSPTDACEREADALATRVLAAPADAAGAGRPNAVTSPQVQRECDSCEDEDKKRDEEMPEGQIQRRGQGTPRLTGEMAAAVTGLGSGTPLPTGERQFFEERFGYEFSQVRVHADGKAAEAARALHADAFTLKSDVAFAEGRYQTDSASGRQLLAHELAHVIQQGQAAPLTGALPVQAGGTRIARQEAEAPAGEAEPAAPEPAADSPAPAAAGPTSAPAAETAELAGGGGLIVDDDTATVTSGQERKSEFLAELKVAVCAAADPVLARIGRNTEGCPYIARWLARYSERPASYLERMIRKFAPGATSASSARDYIPLVAARVASGVETWVDTGEVPADIPDELRAELPGGGGGGVLGAIGGTISSAVSAVGSAFSAIGGLFFKAGPGGARAGADRTALASRLGAGQPLASAARTRMEGAFGRSFGEVRVHDDAGAAGLARDLGAHAFTLGEHVAFADGRYQPGTPVGDAILAHELAHVIQQSGDLQELGTAEAQPDAVVEQDADQAAAGAVAALYLPERPPRDRLPRLRSGLRLSRCSKSEQKRTSTADPVTQLLTQGKLDWVVTEQDAHLALQTLKDLQADATKLKVVVTSIPAKEYEQFFGRLAAKDRAENLSFLRDLEIVRSTGMTFAELSDDQRKYLETQAAGQGKGVGEYLRGEATARGYGGYKAKKLTPQERAAWQKRFDAVLSAIRSSAPDEIKRVIAAAESHGGGIFFRSDEVEELGPSTYAFRSGNELGVGKLWVETAETDPANVYENIAHELGGHLEYGATASWTIMQATLNAIPAKERATAEGGPRQLSSAYNYMETEIYAELRELPFRTAGSRGDEPGPDVEEQLGNLKKAFAPKVAEGIIRGMRRRLQLDANITKEALALFDGKVKLVFGLVF